MSDDERVEAAARWLFNRIVRRERAYEMEWPPPDTGAAEGWRREARELLAAIEEGSDTPRVVLPDGYELCESCGGNGQIMLGTPEQQPCEDCQGSGVVEAR